MPSVDGCYTYNIILLFTSHSKDLLRATPELHIVKKVLFIPLCINMVCKEKTTLCISKVL